MSALTDGRRRLWDTDMTSDIAQRVNSLRAKRRADLPLHKDERRLLALFDTPSLRDSIAQRLAP